MSDTRALLSRREVADRLGIPARTLDVWATRDKGPAYIRVGKHARYRWEDVERWLNEQPTGGTAA